MDASAPQSRVFALLPPGEALILGTVVSAAVIAYAGSKAEGLGQLTLAMVGTIVVYSLAHVHALTIGSSLARGHHPVAALRSSLVETWPIAGASAIPLVILLLSSALGADLRTAAWLALLSTVVLLTLYSYFAGSRAGLNRRGCLASAAAGAALGLVVAGLKVALH